MAQEPQNAAVDEVQTAPDSSLTEPFTIVVTYLPEEVNEASWLVFREERAGGMTLGVFCVAFTLTAFLGLLFAGTIGKAALGVLPSSDVGFWIARVALVAAGLVPFLLTFSVWQHWKAKALDTYSKDQRFHMPVLYTIGSTGFQILFPQATSLTDWTKVTACLDLPQSLCLVTDGLIFPIPKRCFVSAQQLLNVRRMIIEKGVRYSTAGKRRADIVYAVAPVSMVFDLTKKETPVDVGEAENNMGDEKLGDNRGLQTVDPIYPKIAPKHPGSSLIGEPLVFQRERQVLDLECTYSLPELRAVDKILFFKYTLVDLGIRYLNILLYVGLVPAAFVSVVSWEGGMTVFRFLAPWLPLLLVGFGFHIWYILDLRLANMQETINLDSPILLELSETDCRVRKRRSFFAHPWHQFVDCLATPDHYICRLPLGSVIIPKRLLDDRTKAAFVENLLRKKIDKYHDWC